MKKLILIISGMIFLNILNPILFYSFAETNEKYIIQAGVFQSQSNANKVYSLLIKNNFPAYKKQKDKIWVYVGEYEDKRKAEEALSEIKELGINGYIKKIYMKENMNIVNTAEAPPEVAQIENNTYKEIKSKNYHLSDDITINGIFGNYTFFVNVEKHWNIRNTAYFELIFSQSEIRKYKNSSLTIEVNNSPIYSTLLDDKGVDKERIKVPIPLDKIREGFNEIKVRTYHRITDEPCADVINPGNWVVFHEDSYVHIEFMEKEDSNSLRDYPYPYLKGNNDTPINNMIVIPDDFRNHELNAAMILAANFGQRYPYTEYDVYISKFSEAINKNKNNIIYIGSKDNTLPEILSLLSDDEINSISNRALIKEIKSPYNNDYKVLLILSNHEETLLKAIKALSNDKMISQMDKPYQFIPNTLNIDEENLPQSEYIYLEDLGYSNINLEGIFYQKASFGVNIPRNWVLKEGTLLHLDMRYSEILNFERSVLTVYLNDVPIGSKQLYSENANNDVLDIEIPKEVRDDNYYNLKIVFYLELNSQDCNYRRDINSWAFISNKSYLYLPHENRKDSYFEYYETPFINNKKFNDLLIVVPQNSSSYEMSIAGTIVAALGRGVNSLEDMVVTTSNEDIEKFRDKNLIIIGTPNKNDLIKNINDQLYIKFNKDFSEFLSNEKMVLLDDYNSNIASLQLIKSPFNKNRKALIITATKDEGLSWAQKFLTDMELVNRLKGDAVVIDKWGNIQWEYYGNLNDKEQKILVKKKKDTKQDVKKVIASKQVRNFIIFVIVILSFIIVSSILVIRRNR